MSASWQNEDEMIAFISRTTALASPTGQAARRVIEEWDRWDAWCKQNAISMPLGIFPLAETIERLRRELD